MIRNFILLLILGAGLWACSDVYTITAEDRSTEVNASIPSDPALDSLIAPYRDSLSATMDVVIAYAPEDFTKGRPNAALNNWAADAILMNSPLILMDSMDISKMPVMCLLNVGGLRNSINQGDVTIGDIFKLMPFDNEVVWVQMPWESREAIVSYLTNKGGEPIAGAKLIKDSLHFQGNTEAPETFWVITSDYLMNGGDKMDFFEQKISHHYSDMLMRDVFLEAAKAQDTLVFNDNERIQL